MQFFFFLATLSFIFQWGESTSTCQNANLRVVSSAKGPTVCMSLNEYQKQTVGVNATKGEKGERGVDGQKGESGGTIEGGLHTNGSCSCYCIKPCPISSSNVVSLNVGGTVFMTTVETLTQDPRSILATMVANNQSEPDGTYFFDRDPTHFRYILNYLRTGLLYDDQPDTDLARKELLFEARYYNVSAMVRLFNPFKDSAVLPYDSQYQNVMMSWLQEDGISSDWNLIYRGTRDGFAASSFHTFCDNKGPTITLIKSVGDCIFGGYSDVSWTSRGAYIESTDAFLFAFVSNGLGTTPFRGRVFQNAGNAMYDNSGYGPTFGGGFDLYIASDSNSNTNSYMNWGNTYELPDGYTHGGSGQTWICGYNFQTIEIEVFALASSN
ncbi:uncharacterized protein [Oscarella lobularis]|uniref:uncharacterized protein isoform X1 n=1 Tax=Oscarella lobularis TaxID=121494 RepID=UPI0033144312